MLDDVSVAIPDGPSALLGPSGSGKSSLLRLLNRLSDPEFGSILFKGEDVRKIDVLELRRRAVLVPQLPALLPGTVAENVRYGPALRDRSADVNTCLGRAGLARTYADRDAAKLSVGEQQRVMLARALALEPEVLLLDEPTAALDEAARDGVERTLEELARTGVAMVLVTHDRGQALQDHVEGHRAAGRPAGLLSSIDVTLTEVAASLVLVAIAIAVSRWRRAELEVDLAVAVLRSFVQLTAVGYVIQAIFDSDSLLLVAALLAVMVAFGTITARGRAKGVPRALVPIALALTVAAVTTLGLVLALGIFEAKPRFLVPVGGMVIGNAMTAAAVALNRLADEVGGSRTAIEATLSLGATSRQAASARGHAQPALGNDHPGRLDEDDRHRLLPRCDDRDARGRRGSAGCGPAAADPPVVAAGQRVSVCPDRDRPGLPRLLHSGSSAARRRSSIDRSRCATWSAASCG